MKFRITRFVAQLREKDEETKKWWVIGASAVSMIAIIFLWILYLNFTLPSVNIPMSSSTVPIAPSVSKKTSPLDTFMEGWRVVSKDIRTKWKSFSDETMRGISKIGEEFKKRNEILIEGDNSQFIPNTSTEPIPPTRLP